MVEKPEKHGVKVRIPLSQLSVSYFVPIFQAFQLFSTETCLIPLFKVTVANSMSVTDVPYKM
jgi:hypothetical protein